MILNNATHASYALISGVFLLFFNTTLCMKKVPSYSDVEMALYQSNRIDADFEEVPLLVNTKHTSDPKNPTLAQLDKTLLDCCNYSGSSTESIRLYQAYKTSVSELIESDSVLAQDAFGKTRLHYAVYVWNNDLIANLLSFKADRSIANVPDNNGETGLHALLMRDPCTAHEAEQILHLIGFAHQHGARLTIPNIDGETLLHYAVRYQVCDEQRKAVRKRLIEALVTRGIDINQQTLFTGQTPLHYALKNYPDNIRSLACCRLSMIPTLLGLGANPNQEDSNDGNTPLHCMATNNCLQDCTEIIDITSLLLNNSNRTAKNANANALNKLGYAPLHLLMHLEPTSPSIAVGRQLLASMRDPNTLSRDGYAPLHIAVCNKKFKWVQMLCECPDVNCFVVRTPQSTQNDAEVLEIATPLDMAYKISHDGINSDSSTDASSEGDSDSTSKDFYEEWDESESPYSHEDNLNQTEPLTQIMELLESEAINYLNKRLIKSASDTDKWFKVALFGKLPDFEAQDDEGNTRLHYAVEFLDLEMVHVILQSPTETALINIPNTVGETPLLYGCKTKFRDQKNFAQLFSNLFKNLIEGGADLDAANNQDDTILHYLLHFISKVDFLDLELLQIILKSPSKIRLINKPNKREETPLLFLLKQKFARHHNPAQVVHTLFNMLIDAGASLDVTNSEDETPLHYLVRFQGQDVHTDSILTTLKKMIEAQATLDAPTLCGETPLHYVFKYNALDKCADTNESILSILLSNQANPNAITDSGETPLHYALTYAIMENTISARKAAIEALVASGAIVDVATPMGETPLSSIFKTCYYKDSGLVSVESRLPYVKVLLQLGANPNTQDALGNTPLHCLMNMRWSNNLHLIARQLIKLYKAQTTLVNKAGHTPLHITTANERPQWVELLLEDPLVDPIRSFPATIERAHQSKHSNKSALDLALELRQVRLHPAYNNLASRSKLEIIDRMNQGSLNRVIDLLMHNIRNKYSEESICKQMLFLVLLSSCSTSL